MVKTLQITFLVLVISWIFECHAQPACSFKHYSIEDGLPQFTATDILQDKKGFIWISTFDGLSKFDGYEFYNYKTKPGDPFLMKSNRIDRIHEDRYGRIWMESYGGEAHCFNPTTEKFWGLRDSNGIYNHPDAIKRIAVKPSGLVWIITNHNGCICVMDTLYNTVVYSIENGNLPNNTVNAVHEDSEKNTWILTNNGIIYITAQQKEMPSNYFVNDTGDSSLHQGFYTINEFDNEIWFGRNKGKIEIYNKSTHDFTTIQIPASSNITYISKLTEDEVLLGTASDGIAVYHRSAKDFKWFNRNNLPHLRSNKLQIVHATNPDQIWFTTDELGIYLLRHTTGKITYFKVPTEEISASLIPAGAFVREDLTGRIWVHPKGGGFSIYNEQTNTLEPFYNLPNSPNRRFSNILHSAFFDRSGNLWFGTRSNGLEKATFNNRLFSTFFLSEDGEMPIKENIRALYEDSKGRIWLAIRGANRIAIFDKQHHLLGYLSQEGEIKKYAEWSSTIYSIMGDIEGNVWLGTRGDGIYRLSPRNQDLSFGVAHYSFEKDNPYSLSDNNVYAMYQDNKQRIWIATFGGGINLINNQKENGVLRFINHRNEWKNYPMENHAKVRCLNMNSQGHMYAGTTGGLLVFSSAFKTMDEADYRRYTKEGNNKDGLSANDVIDLCFTREGEMYIGTFGGGLNKVISFDSRGFPSKFKTYAAIEGLPSDLIQGILEDSEGNLWISTQSELVRFRPGTEHFETFSEARRIVGEHYFSEATRITTNAGIVLFGYSNGLVIFSPNDIKTSRHIPYLAFTNFQLFNKKIPIGNNSPLKFAIDDCQKLVLSHKQNYFTLEFAALDFENTRAIRYAYILEGFDTEWNYTQKQRMVSYTNIPRGEYVFKVKSTNSEGIWVDNQRELSIVIEPSFWRTPIAYALYLLLFAVVIFLIDYNVLTIYRLKSDVKMEKKMSEIKLKFFTDISHEIRTPLTLITAPVEYLINDPRTPDMVKKQLHFISQNTNRMLRLVNQILDLRKMQNIRLNVTAIELAPFVQTIYNDFSELAEEQGIEFTFRNEAGHAVVWADRDSLEKMVMNLLSNAFKHIANGKKIEVVTLQTEKYLIIRVTDDGPGIAKERVKNLFVRFDSFSNDPSKPSTGIGLALVKELADKHSARVIVESEVGKGSSFQVQFLPGTAHFKNEDVIIDSIDGSKVSAMASSNKRQTESMHVSIEKTQPTVLVVEDDPELRLFLKNILEHEYETLEAEDGIIGFELALEHNPDFIVSDIMMPRMNGIELLKRLRNDVATSHIPVVMLTAKTDIESQLEGLSYGADDYITKPFSVPYFKTRIVNLLQQRKRLQEIFSGSDHTAIREYNPKPFLITSHDEELMANIMATIEKNIDNGDFTVEELSVIVGIGRTTLFNKIKSLTGLSPLEFIRDIRLKRAAQLLTDSELFVKEVSYMTGFSDTKYFGKCFKAKYGVTPMDYRNKN